MTEKLTCIQNKFDKMDSNSEMLQNKTVVAERTTSTIQKY